MGAQKPAVPMPPRRQKAAPAGKEARPALPSSKHVEVTEVPEAGEGAPAAEKENEEVDELKNEEEEDEFEYRDHSLTFLLPRCKACLVPIPNERRLRKLLGPGLEDKHRDNIKRMIDYLQAHGQVVRWDDDGQYQGITDGTGEAEGQGQRLHPKTLHSPDPLDPLDGIAAAADQLLLRVSQASGDQTPGTTPKEKAGSKATVLPPLVSSRASSRQARSRAGSNASSIGSYTRGRRA